MPPLKRKKVCVEFLGDMELDVPLDDHGDGQRLGDDPSTWTPPKRAFAVIPVMEDGKPKQMIIDYKSGNLSLTDSKLGHQWTMNRDTNAKIKLVYAAWESKNKFAIAVLGDDKPLLEVTLESAL